MKTTKEFLEKLKTICNEADVDHLYEDLRQFVEDNIWDNDRYMKEYETGFKTGQTNTIDSAVNYLREQAGQKFIEGWDKEAQTLRTLALSMKTAITPKENT
jgi:hypothetical protein